MKITNKNIGNDSSISLLEFNIGASGFTDIFSDGNCCANSNTKATFTITNCATVNCTTIDCKTIDCTTIDCKTVNCKKCTQCNTVECTNCHECASYKC